MTADRLDPALLHHVVNTLGWPGLRPVQDAAVAPIVDGLDTLVLASTAGGKTEAALFPLMTRMAAERWPGLSILYVCPLRALLNNLEPRVAAYTGWLGRRAAIWHGDVTPSARRRILADPPEVLLTTPESLEAMLISGSVRADEIFANVRAVLVDEVHAFAGDDRGWHLLAVLERISRIAAAPLQRVGLSATVGNPKPLLAWLQGSSHGRPAQVVQVDAPLTVVSAVPAVPPGEVVLDHVGSLDAVATVVAGLHSGEKRLVFCESRRAVESLSHTLRERGLQVFVSHSSLSADERRRAETAFADSRDCVIVSTSTLELGIDVGDLDRVIQVDGTGTVASFLQRLGRTGRRPGTSRNALVLTTRNETFLQMAAVLLLWSRRWVEDVEPPPSPRHIAAQQLLGLCLQRGQVGRSELTDAWGGLAVLEDDRSALVEHLVQTGQLTDDGGLLAVGPETERRFGRRYYRDLVAVFTAAPEVDVVHGRQSVGSIDPWVLTRKVAGPRRLILGGRSWQVTHVDWPRRRCFVEPSDIGALTKWHGAPVALSSDICRAARLVLLGTDPNVVLSRRAAAHLIDLRESFAAAVRPVATVVSVREGWWWTWAGLRANIALLAALPEVAGPVGAVDNFRLRLRQDLSADEVSAAFAVALGRDIPLPDLDDGAVALLKFAEVLPPSLAKRTVAERLSDVSTARRILAEPVIING